MANIGQSKQLGLIMTSYTPHVACLAPFARWHYTPDYFYSITKMFPWVDKGSQTFGQDGVVKLPWRILGSGESLAFLPRAYLKLQVYHARDL